MGDRSPGPKGVRGFFYEYKGSTLMFSDPILGCYGIGRFVDWLSSKFATKNELNADSGVTAGSYGPTADATPSAGGSITVPQVTVDKRGRVTGATDRTITLPAGGGGGGEEQFQKVYETTLAAEAPVAQITSSDMGGIYTDIFVAVNFDSTQAGDVIFVEFYSGETQLCTQEYTENLNNTLTGITSLGGIHLCWKTDDTGNVCNNYIDISRSILYPTAELPGITQLLVEMEPEGEQALSGGSVTVYARKKVTAPE